MILESREKPIDRVFESAKDLLIFKEFKGLVHDDFIRRWEECLKRKGGGRGGGVKRIFSLCKGVRSTDGVVNLL